MQRKITYITESSGYGGSETYLLDLATAARNIAEVSVALPFRDENLKLREELQKKSIKTINLQQYRANYLWNIAIALKFFLQNKSHLYHFTLSYPNSCRWLLLAASLLRRKYIISELLVPPNPFKAGFYFLVTHLLFNGLKRLSYVRAAKVVPNCKAMKNILVRAYKMPAEKITVIYNGIDLGGEAGKVSNSEALRGEFKLKQGDLILTTAGRLMEQKGHRYLIAAFEKLVAQIPPLVLLIIGEGPLESVLKEDAANRGLTDHVRFVGFREDFRSILLMSHIFLFPSLDEGFPYVIMDAMAAGLPVIATAVGGIPEAVVDGETGLLVPPHDVEQLYLASMHLLNDSDKRKKMGEKSRNRVEKLFSRKIMIQEMFSLYEDIQ